ncbi:MAG TPA: PilZ domain-containing protein [Terriglobales bacterium]|nr:PilZ domain-containing protein [Terriglobales bacterium]
MKALAAGTSSAFMTDLHCRFGGNVQLQENQRDSRCMRSSHPEQREHSRIQLPIRAIAIFPQAAGVPQTALLRDVNMLGAFFYCQESPHLGQTVILDFYIAEHGNKTDITCEGIVVRVEAGSSGCAVGVGLRFTHYELIRQSNRLRCTLQPKPPPFITWTIDKVERLSQTSRTN